MKTLCLQLARFGDIYQTWPVLNALKRVNPESELHFMVREKFSDAAKGLPAIDQLKILYTGQVLEPLLDVGLNIDESLNRLSSWVSALSNEKYDRIINLSFSPFSSYLVDMITHPHTLVTGYTRFADGFLSIPDDASSYFYSQVGVQRSNRIHLTDLFALIAGVELHPTDFNTGAFANTPSKFSQSNLNAYGVIHLGASHSAKTCSSDQWIEIIKKLETQYEGHIVLVGTEDEGRLHQNIYTSGRVINLCGQTKIFDLFGVLQKSQFLLGGDSVLLHMASLSLTPTLNISFASVNFWETGPRAPLSRVILFNSTQNVDAEQVVQELLRLVRGEAPSPWAVEKNHHEGVLYSAPLDDRGTFSWELTKSLYMNNPFPQSNSGHIDMGFLRLKEVTVVALEQIELLGHKNSRPVAVQLLDQADELIQKIAQLVPEISPLIRWFQTEKLRIAPGSIEEITSNTKSIFEKLRDICQLYALNHSFEETMPREDLNWKP